jgi:putative sterol carrier protein
MMNAIDMLNKLPAALNVEAVDGMDCTVQLHVSQSMVVTVCEGVCTVNTGTVDAPDVTLTLLDDSLIALLTGQMNAVTAFLTGKVKVDGDLMLAKEFASYFDASKLAA